MNAGRRRRTLCRWKRRLALFALAAGACQWALAQAAPAVPAAASAAGAAQVATAPGPFRLVWQIERNEFTPQTPDGRGRASFELSNLGDKALPARGWALYFNAIAGVVLGATDGPFTLEHVTGTLYRARPTAGFPGLPAGQSMQIRLLHPEAMIKLDKAPAGPYLVFDDTAAVGWAIDDYRVAMPTRPEQLDKGPGDNEPVISPATLYERNARITDLPVGDLAPVFPTPLGWLALPGAPVRWARMPVVQAPAELAAEAGYARALLQPLFPAPASAATQHLGTRPLLLQIGPVDGLSSPEAYELTIEPEIGVKIVGNSASGVFRGLQSLRQLLPAGAQPQGLALSSMVIRDTPRFAYRGLQLDVARNFQDKDAILRLLDLMARYKLNKFHFHLTDDEGWRLEIRGLPELTGPGARRGHGPDPLDQLPPAYGSGPDRNDPHGSGFYRRADYVAILRYAAQRHIEVIPEIEMPGHARAAVKAMEARFHRLAQAGRADAGRYLVSDPHDRSVYTSPQQYNDQVINPGMASTYVFIEKVVAEVAALHREAGVPLRTLHVGGDELADGAWERSPACEALMRREHLGSTADLWDYFYDRVDRILQVQGVRASGWEELGARKVRLHDEARLIPNPHFAQHGFVLYVWNNVAAGAQDLAYRLANAGYDTVLAPVTNLYFDMAHNKNPEEPGVNWGGYVDLQTVFDFVPLDFLRTQGGTAACSCADALTDYGQKHVLGLEATLFSETMREPARIDYMLMPRMLGLAERAWASDPAWAQGGQAMEAAHALDWSRFVNQLGRRVLPALDAEGAGVLYRIPPPGLRVVDGKVLANLELPGLVLRYATDGSEPTPQSAMVDGPISEHGDIRVAAFNSAGRRGWSSHVSNP